MVFFTSRYSLRDFWHMFSRSSMERKLASLPSTVKLSRQLDTSAADFIISTNSLWIPSNRFVSSGSWLRMSSEYKKMGSKEAHEWVTFSHTLKVDCMRPKVSFHMSTRSLKNSINLPIPSTVWSSSWSASKPSTTNSEGLMTLMSGLDREGSKFISIVAQFFSTAASLVSILSSLVAVSTISETSSRNSCKFKTMMSLSVHFGLVGSRDFTPHVWANICQCRLRMAGLCSSVINSNTVPMFLMDSSMSRYTCQPFMTGFSLAMPRRFLLMALFRSSSASVSAWFQSMVFQSANTDATLALKSHILFRAPSSSRVFLVSM
mmetsp:Transcript_49271/g.99168  ORF Transcript_49271/g.99168 Transcript_49271/m.99168 type:complete len:319 (+) Transcript_49271:3298-4254(+)